jgi:hypothetical protein
VTAATDKITTAEPSRRVLRKHETSVKARPWALALVPLWAALIAALGIGYQWDAAQLVIGARALLASQNPYDVVPTRFPYPLVYPLPAVLLALPLAHMGETTARVLWALAGGAVFAWTARARPPLLAAAVSAPFIISVLLGHLGPAMLAGVAFPWLGFLWAAKPSLGLALFLAYPSWRAAISCAIFGAVSLAVMPDWPAHWWADLMAGRPALVTVPGGALLLLGLLRWRTPEGRLLAALCLIPHGRYDALVLYLIPRTVRESLGLSVVGMAGAIVSAVAWPFAWGVDYGSGPWVLALATAYLPALWLVLSRPRPATSGRGCWSRGWDTTRRAAPAST